MKKITIPKQVADKQRKVWWTSKRLEKPQTNINQGSKSIDGKYIDHGSFDIEEKFKSKINKSRHTNVI